MARTEYGEADRILTILTPDQGKLRLMARGVRKPKSKLAGGIELFSVSDIVFIRGKSEIGTLVSARLDKHFGNIIKDIERVQLGYEVIKQLNKATEDGPESDYFDLLQQAFEALDIDTISCSLIRTWFQAQLLKLGGYTPNLETDVQGQKLEATEQYNFDFNTVSFVIQKGGQFAADEIKYLRLLFSSNQPKVLCQVQNHGAVLQTLTPLIQTVLHDSTGFGY